MHALGQEGMFTPIVAALDDPVSLEADAAGAVAAAAAMARIDADLAHIAQGGAERAGLASRYGQEITAGLGLTALAGAVIAMALS